MKEHSQDKTSGLQSQNVAPEINQQPTNTESASPKTFNPFNLFWGLLLVMLGVLLVLNNYNIISVDMANILSLWPVLLIVAGFSMLSIKGKLGLVLSSLLLVAMLVLISLAATGAIGVNSSQQNQVKTAAIAKASAEVSLVKLSVETGAGKLRIDSDDMNHMVKANLNSSHSTLKQSTSQSKGTQNIAISTNSTKGWWRGNYSNDLSLTVNQTLPTEVKIEAGASDIVADLSEVVLRELEIDSGASDIDIKLGQKSNLTKVAIQLGMSSIKFTLPRESGISLQIDGGMSSKSTEGLRDVGDGRFQSENYATSANKINIQGDMGMASLDLEYY